MKQQDQQLIVVAQTIGSGGVWLEDATVVGLPGGQVLIPGLRLFGVEPPPPPPPPLTATQLVEKQMAKQKENEEKFQSMISELQMSVDSNKEFANATAQQMASFDKRLLTLGQVAGTNVLEIQHQFSEKLSESIDAIVLTQKRVIELGTSQERAREREGASI